MELDLLKAIDHGQSLPLGIQRLGGVARRAGCLVPADKKVESWCPPWWAASGHKSSSPPQTTGKPGWDRRTLLFCSCHVNIVSWDLAKARRLPCGFSMWLELPHNWVDGFQGQMSYALQGAGTPYVVPFQRHLASSREVPQDISGRLWEGLLFRLKMICLLLSLLCKIFWKSFPKCGLHRMLLLSAVLISRRRSYFRALFHFIREDLQHVRV